MHEKRYSVFISSTFEDLRDERRAVQDTVIAAGDFPVQMESFPASDEAAFELIKSLLDKCDYYILIIAGRYGSISDDGTSFTHREFRYAVDRKIPVLFMLHGDRGKIPAVKTENNDEGKKLLNDLISEASNGRTRKEWTTIGELKAEVLSALVNAKNTRPRVGWIRGDAVASVDALEELNEVRKANDKLRDALGEAEIEIPRIQLPAFQDACEIDFLADQPPGMRTRGSSGTIRSTWMALFPLIHGNLSWGTDSYSGEYHINYNESCSSVGSALVQEVSDEETSGFFKLSKGAMRKLVAYYIEAGLMQPEGSDNPFTAAAEKLARRNHFVNEDKPNFRLSRGTTTISAAEYTAPSEDIPF